ncbi:uncharacterized protein LOC106506012 [Sus scrofa]|uniref:uncharacterized protein LOC106506012 n=1 Tax=Sus scrofa TaxID=9823 RepID=UPI000A2B841A|nr:uncharacterized protein LOC106506012 [Sus scrofa]
MKPGPGVSGRWGAGGEGASASCRLGGPRLGGGLPGRNVHGTWKTPALPARSRQGRGRATCAPLFSVPGAPPTPVQLLALCPRLWRKMLLQSEARGHWTSAVFGGAFLVNIVFHASFPEEPGLGLPHPGSRQEAVCSSSE